MSDDERHHVQDAKPISSDKFSRLMAELQASQAHLESQIFTLKAEMPQGKEEAALRALKRARLEKPYTY